MIPKTILFSDQMNASIPVSVSLSGELTTAIQMTATITINVTPSGALTTAILMLASMVIALNIPNPALFTAKLATRLAECGHPMFTKCERTHLGDDI
jgi:hypothetical protein